MVLERGAMFELDGSSLPGVEGQLIQPSKLLGSWVVACHFPNRGIGVIAVVPVEAWFELGRWSVSHVDAVPDVPAPHYVVRSGRQGVDCVVDIEGVELRPARPGELEILGRPRVVSPSRLLKACNAFIGNTERTPSLDDLRADAYLFKQSFMGGELDNS